MSYNHKLQLVWPNKDVWSSPEPRILIEKQVFTSEFKGHQDNLLIKADNLLALKSLEKKYTGKIKCIYIDPPYNTKSCFKHYDDGMEHSLWLNMIKERLVILHNLLADDGSLWISIDDSECHYLKVICDEIFGRKNFITSIIWQQRTTRENRRAFSVNHEYILIYAKNPSKFECKKNNLELTDEVLKRYKIIVIKK
jgi:adenine-specific DNA-methyltransferase